MKRVFIITKLYQSFVIFVPPSNNKGTTNWVMSFKTTNHSRLGITGKFSLPSGFALLNITCNDPYDLDH